ncbi:MAG TPA: hypothetical protein VKT73_04570 [Xanthobacteraceae bacterium]|nr:hypothetical protein [Xanthobacteraceae bacterium]
MTRFDLLVDAAIESVYFPLDNIKSYVDAFEAIVYAFFQDANAISEMSDGFSHLAKIVRN